jgi:hypothetical protein
MVLPTLQRFPKIYYNEESTRRTENHSKNDSRPRNTRKKILSESGQHLTMERSAFANTRSKRLTKRYHTKAARTDRKLSTARNTMHMYPPEFPQLQTVIGNAKKGRSNLSERSEAVLNQKRHHTSKLVNSLKIA